MTTSYWFWQTEVNLTPKPEGRIFHSIFLYRRQKNYSRSSEIEFWMHAWTFFSRGKGTPNNMAKMVSDYCRRWMHILGKNALWDPSVLNTRKPPRTIWLTSGYGSLPYSCFHFCKKWNTCSANIILQSYLDSKTWWPACSIIDNYTVITFGASLSSYST